MTRETSFSQLGALSPLLRVLRILSISSTAPLLTFTNVSFCLAVTAPTDLAKICEISSIGPCPKDVEKDLSKVEAATSFFVNSAYNSVGRVAAF